MQAVLFALVYMLGLAFAIALGPHRRIHLCASLAFPLGLVLWIVSLFASYGLILKVSSLAALALYTALLVVCIAIGIRRRRFCRAQWPALLWLAAFSAVALFLSSFNASRFTPDSMNFVIGGEILWEHGLDGLAWSTLAHRSVFHPLAHAISGAIGLDFLYSYHLMLTTSFAVAFALVLSQALARSGVLEDRRWILSLLTTATLMTTYIVLWHSSYVHANLSSGFYLWAFVALFWIAEVDRDPDLLVLSAVAMVGLGLQRLETGVVVATFSALLLSDTEHSRATLRRTLGVGISVVSFWLFAVAMHGTSRFVSPSKSAAIIAMMVVPFAFHQARLAPALVKKVPPLMLAAVTAATILAFATAPEHMAKATTNLAHNLFVLPHMWGITPIVLVALGFIAARSRRIPFERAMAYGIPVFVLFVVTIVRLRGSYRVAWGDSGNRMMLHIIPLCFFFFATKLGSKLVIGSPLRRLRRPSQSCHEPLSRQ